VTPSLHDFGAALFSRIGFPADSSSAIALRSSRASTVLLAEIIDAPAGHQRGSS
jgi:hypothetical protein